MQNETKSLIKLGAKKTPGTDGGAKETQIAFTVAPISFYVKEKRGSFRQFWGLFMQERQRETRHQGTDPQRNHPGFVSESNE